MEWSKHRDGLVWTGLPSLVKSLWNCIFCFDKMVSFPFGQNIQYHGFNMANWGNETHSGIFLLVFLILMTRILVTYQNCWSQVTWVYWGLNKTLKKLVKTIVKTKNLFDWDIKYLKMVWFDWLWIVHNSKTQENHKKTKFGLTIIELCG